MYSARLMPLVLHSYVVFRLRGWASVLCFMNQSFAVIFYHLLSSFIWTTWVDLYIFLLTCKALKLGIGSLEFWAGIRTLSLGTHGMVCPWPVLLLLVVAQSLVLERQNRWGCTLHSLDSVFNETWKAQSLWSKLQGIVCSLWSLKKLGVQQGDMLFPCKLPMSMCSRKYPFSVFPQSSQLKMYFCIALL